MHRIKLPQDQIALIPQGAACLWMNNILPFKETWCDMMCCLLFSMTVVYFKSWISPFTTNYISIKIKDTWLSGQTQQDCTLSGQQFKLAWLLLLRPCLMRQHMCVGFALMLHCRTHQVQCSMDVAGTKVPPTPQLSQTCSKCAVSVVRNCSIIDWDVWVDQKWVMTSRSGLSTQAYFCWPPPSPESMCVGAHGGDSATFFFV